jgi:hypothetical protein
MTCQKSLSLVRNVLFVFTAACLLASCQDDEILPTPADVISETAPDEDGNFETNITSLTITGENTVFAESVDCSTCTYVVAKNTDTIDGKALGLKPGSVICLDKALQYGELTFENLEGTEEHPITIGNCNGQ